MADEGAFVGQVDLVRQPGIGTVPAGPPPVEAKTFGAQRFLGRICLVTGAATGIGEAITLRLLAEGASVIAADLDLNGLRKMIAKTDATGRAAAMRVDVRSTRSIAALSHRIVGRYGYIDVLVNNAGTHFRGDILETDPQTWDEVFAVNLRGVYLMCRAFLPVLLARAQETGDAAIVNTASVVGLATNPHIPAYATSKAGVIALTRSLAIDYATSGLRVNCVCPGTIHTPMTEELWVREGNRDNAYLRTASQNPVKYLGRPDDVAAAVAYIASIEARFMTGSAIVIDGGRSAALGHV
jgi:NAD(P)-dependent dehydrogenase (short-subunit alcohol dehydrogenase family)